MASAQLGRLVLGLVAKAFGVGNDVRCSIVECAVMPATSFRGPTDAMSLPMTDLRAQG
jgi:hypothetical protein